jgi:hypothetical protein
VVQGKMMGKAAVNAVEVAERYADGLASQHEREEAYGPARIAVEETPVFPEPKRHWVNNVAGYPGGSERGEGMIEDFTRLNDAIRRFVPTARLTPLGDSEITAMRSQFPDVPDHYLNFLQHVGWGSLGDNFMLYSGLVEANEIFDSRTSADLAGILFLGDNLAGWMLGFDTRNRWRLVGVDSSSPTPEPEQAQTVGDFFAQRASEWDSA